MAALALFGGDEIATPPLDPSCFAAVAGVVDPEAEPMQIFGCRDRSEVPAPKARGWVTCEPADGGFVRGRRDPVNVDGVWTFPVMSNGGGSGNFEYIVTGEPDGNGIIQSSKVEALPAR